MRQAAYAYSDIYICLALSLFLAPVSGIRGSGGGSGGEGSGGDGGGGSQ